MKVVRLSAQRTAAFTHQDILLILISVRGGVNSRSKVRPEGICQRKIQMTPSGIEPATFRLVAQLRRRVPRKSQATFKCISLGEGKLPSGNYVEAFRSQVQVPHGYSNIGIGKGRLVSAMSRAAPALSGDTWALFSS